jgi:hypothetical protein
MLSQNNINKNFIEASIDVKAIATYYPGLIRVYEPKVPIRKLLPDWEAQTTTKISLDADKTSNEDNLERSIRRSQKIVSDYVLCNRFKLFATITIAQDRYSPEQSKNKVQNWLKNQRTRTGKFTYILVPEYHKDGALHFHALIGGFLGEVRQSINSKNGNPLSRKGKFVYELPSFTSGFTKVQYIGQTAEDHAKVGNYIRKYITKDMVSIFNKKRFWTSQGLNKPIQEDNPQWYLETLADEIFENEYGKIFTYTNLQTKILPSYIDQLTSDKNL